MIILNEEISFSYYAVVPVGFYMPSKLRRNQLCALPCLPSNNEHSPAITPQR